MTEWIAADEARQRLGVRPQTLYAYVSRGRVTVRPDPEDPRRSLYRADDVAALQARKSRSRKAADVAEGAVSWGEPVLSSAIMTVAGGRLYYRGRDAIDLAGSESLESVARLLRGGQDEGARPATRPDPPKGDDARARLFRALAARAAADPPALGRTPQALAAEAATLLDAVADAAAGQQSPLPIHE
ncbi:MAG: citrate synthase, partial [Phenylobacterium sp.]